MRHNDELINLERTLNNLNRKKTLLKILNISRKPTAFADVPASFLEYSQGSNVSDCHKLAMASRT